MHTIVFYSCLTQARVIRHHPLLPNIIFHHLRRFKLHFLFMSSCLTAFWPISWSSVTTHCWPTLVFTISEGLSHTFYSCHCVWQLFDTCTCLASSVTIHCSPTSFLAISESLSHTFYSCHRVWHLLNTCPASSVTIHSCPRSFSPSEGLSHTFYSCHHVWQLFDACPASSVTTHCYPTSFFVIWTLSKRANTIFGTETRGKKGRLPICSRGRS